MRSRVTSIEEEGVNQLEEQPSLPEQCLTRRVKLKELQDAGQDLLQITEFMARHHSTDIRKGFKDLGGTTTSMASRIMSERSMGKAVFCDLQDGRDRIQLYVCADGLGGEASAKSKKIDIGDIVGVEGEVFKTKRGETSVKTHRVTLLSRPLQPLPEKSHDLTDKEMRYRQCYVNLIISEDMRHVLHIRTAFIKYMRRYSDERDYLEVETPALNATSGDATARPFTTHHNTLDIDMCMRIATEPSLKRFTVGGLGRAYETSRISRNRGVDPKHNPEFTTVELYGAYTDSHDMMDIAEGVLLTAAKEILGSYHVTWLGNEIDLAPGWKRMAMIDVVRGYVGVGFEAISDDEEVCKATEAKGVDLEGCEYTWGTALYEAFGQQVGEKLIQPTFVAMYPMEVSSLTKRSPKDPRLIECFKLFIDHCEFANAFSELNDPIDQRGRLEHKLALREMGNDEAGTTDEDLTNVPEYGPSPADGMDIGVDRCVMLFINSGSIRDAILFPTMKPLDKSEPAKRVVTGANYVVPAAEQGPVDFSKVETEPLSQEFVDFETFAKSDFRAVKVGGRTTVPKSKKLLKFIPGDGTGEDRVILSGIHDTYEPEELVGETLIAITNLLPRKTMDIDFYGMTVSVIHREEGVEKSHRLMVGNHIPVGVEPY